MYNESWGFWISTFGKYFIPKQFKHHWDTIALTPGQQSAINIQTAGNCHTAICGLRHFIVPPTPTAPPAGDYLIDFTLTLSIDNNDLQDGAINSGLYGNGIYPFETLPATASVFQLQPNMPAESFTFPEFIDPGGSIQGQITNGLVSGTMIHLVFDCVKLFPRPEVPEAKTMRPLDLLFAMSTRQAIMTPRKAA